MQIKMKKNQYGCVSAKAEFPANCRALMLSAAAAAGAVAQAPRSTARRSMRQRREVGSRLLLLAAGALTSKGSARDSPAALTWAARAHVRRHEQQQQRLLDGIQRRQLVALPQR